MAPFQTHRMARLSRILDLAYLAGAWLAGAMMVCLAGLILYSVLARLLGLYSGGANDVAGYAMATSTFLALAYGFRSGGHIRVVLAISKLPRGGRRAAEYWCLGLMSAISVFLATYMVRLLLDSYKWEDKSQGADAILLWIPQLPVAIGAVLFAVAVIHTLAEAVFDYERVEGRRGTPDEI